ncbi:uncharacterized protein ARMOST_07495 [Armillaria ostoyae]|uniref:Uncharacterized protein n=1 Tax=Armillaria ostoyae TaxID=47428 RepID=A0A284R5Z9_ARMOS|nr:uncharacterized protein ARMOST_07495 [Armillaria ostoyae]
MTSEDFAFVMTRTCRLTSLCLGFVDRGLAKPLSSIFPTSNRPSLYSFGIALTLFHYFMEVSGLSFLHTDTYVQGVKPMLHALRELQTQSVYSVIPEIQSLVDINGDTLRTLDAIFLCVKTARGRRPLSLKACSVLTHVVLGESLVHLRVLVDTLCSMRLYSTLDRVELYLYTPVVQCDLLTWRALRDTLEDRTLYPNLITLVVNFYVFNGTLFGNGLDDLCTDICSLWEETRVTLVVNRVLQVGGLRIGMFY